MNRILDLFSDYTFLMGGDAAIGIVFPLLFSIAIILITRYAGSVHLDTDAVLLGELAFAPFDRLILFGKDIGAKSIYTAGFLLFLNAMFILIFFKELKLATFDPLLAAVLGFAPVMLHYALMMLVSLTTVGAFEAVGSVLVVAFMIGPPSTAYRLTNDLKRMMLLSALYGALNALLGFQTAAFFDVSIAGSMAVMTGLSFFLVFLIAPERGLISAMYQRRAQRVTFAESTLLFHLYNHEGSSNEREEAGMDTLQHHLKWDLDYTQRIVQRLSRAKQLEIEGGVLRLTPSGRERTLRDYREMMG